MNVATVIDGDVVVRRGIRHDLHPCLYDSLSYLYRRCCRIRGFREGSVVVLSNEDWLLLLMMPCSSSMGSRVWVSEYYAEIKSTVRRPDESIGTLNAWTKHRKSSLEA